MEVITSNGECNPGALRPNGMDGDVVSKEYAVNGRTNENGLVLNGHHLEGTSCQWVL